VEAASNKMVHLDTEMKRKIDPDKSFALMNGVVFVFLFVVAINLYLYYKQAKHLMPNQKHGSSQHSF
jgi:hypothetical protein